MDPASGGDITYLAEFTPKLKLKLSQRILTCLNKEYGKRGQSDFSGLGLHKR